MVCPFINQNLRGCSEILQLDNVEEAMERCADNFVSCPLFQKNYAKLDTRKLAGVLRKTTNVLLRRGSA